MSPDNQITEDAAQAIHILKSQLELTIKSFSIENRQELIFHILNETVKLLPYKRTSIWDVSGGKPVLLGISGQTEINKMAPLSVLWGNLINQVPDLSEGTVLSRESFPDNQEDWQNCAAADNYSAAWIPLIVKGKLTAGLWFERWEEAPFTRLDIDILEVIARSYSTVWQRKESFWAEWKNKIKELSYNRKSRWVAAFILYILLLHPFRLRVVAPCEVIPDKPEVVCAPVDGVIKEITVKPGQEVKKGDLLALLDDKIAKEQLEVVRQQVKITKAKLERAQIEAFSSDKEKAALHTLKHKLAQEKVRLNLAESQLKRMAVFAGQSGIAMIDRVQEWKGHGLRMGDNIMLIVNKNQSLVRTWIPEADNIDFAEDVPLQVFLDASPFSTLNADISYISHHTELDSQGISSFIVEADWTNPKLKVKPGLKGRAILYGGRTNLFYILIRKPWAGIRKFFGI
ncbi:MAG: efflux RND transporter periplasmic adaptor subunit [Planctomycetota bacterium]|jgi:multidrug resistance efflux pump